MSNYARQSVPTAYVQLCYKNLHSLEKKETKQIKEEVTGLGCVLTPWVDQSSALFDTVCIFPVFSDKFECVTLINLTHITKRRFIPLLIEH